MKINKEILTVWGLIIVVSLVLSGCDLIKKKENLETPPTELKENGQKSLRELLGLNKSMKCELVVDEEKGTKGVFYVSGNKFKQEVTVEGGEEGQKMDIFTMSDGEWIYMWNSLMPKTGTKMKISGLDKENEKVNGAGKIGWDEKKNFVCNPWTAGANEFSLPAGAEFKDITAEMQKLQEELPEKLEGMKDSLCQMCDKATNEEARKECRKQAKCEGE